ncbi:MAG: hypothetical protein F2637_01180 [Actinobacteria bacterium]|jgi:hypothetical protein|nr:hypothetical protein [Actinomycetota bacterium]MSY64679.1 hypothetical protein [Actinomycetota bacterium]
MAYLAALRFLPFFNLAAATIAPAAFIASGLFSRKESVAPVTFVAKSSTDLAAFVMLFKGLFIKETVVVISSINRLARTTVYEMATAITASEEAAIIVAMPPGPMCAEYRKN